MFLFASSPLTYDRGDLEQQQKRIVADRFAKVAWEVPWLLGAMRSAPDFFFDSVSQIRMPRWSSGRAVLVGDAAHAPALASGQGTGLALVGACVLAGELKAAGGDHVMAFPRYEEQMRGFIEKNQKLGQEGIKVMVLRTRWQIWLVLLLLRVLPYMPGKGLFSKRAKRLVQRAATAIELKDYGAEPVAAVRRD